MNRVAHLLFDRPYSILTFLGFGVVAGLMHLIWQPLLFLPLVVLLGLLIYFALFAPKPTKGVEADAKD